MIDPTDFSAWLQTPSGRYLLQWLQTRLDEQVSDLFGYHAVQLGLPALQGLRANRMPHRWLALTQAQGATEPLICTRFECLPFDTQSLDLVVMPHALELSPDPHQLLREVERVLRPEGRLVISGLNPWSLWGARRRMAHWTGQAFPPEVQQMIALPRLKDWLKLLNFELEQGCFGIYRPWCHTEKGLARSAFLDSAGDRWWPVFGGVYLLVAVKRVASLRLIGPAWKAGPAGVPSAAPIANRQP